MKIKIPPIYDEDIIEFALRKGDAVLKYHSDDKIIEIKFNCVYKFDFTEFDYIEETDWVFGLELLESSARIENLLCGLSDEKMQRAFGGESERLQHYRFAIDDNGIYNIICKGIFIA